MALVKIWKRSVSYSLWQRLIHGSIAVLLLWIIYLLLWFILLVMNHLLWLLWICYLLSCIRLWFDLLPRCSMIWPASSWIRVVIVLFTSGVNTRFAHIVGIMHGVITRFAHLSFVLIGVITSFAQRRMHRCRVCISSISSMLSRIGLGLGQSGYGRWRLVGSPLDTMEAGDHGLDSSGQSSLKLQMII